MPGFKSTFIRGKQWILKLAAIPVLGSVPTLRKGSGEDAKKIQISQGITWKVDVVDGIRYEWFNPLNPLPGAVLLYLHGGGGVLGLYNSSRNMTGYIALTCNMSTMMPDYRLAPENPYPAGLNDCIAAYRWLLARGTPPSQIVIAGDSMGGFFTICMLLKLRDIGQPLPAAAVCISPNTDPTLTGKSMEVNASKDALLSPQFARAMMTYYVSDNDLNDPYLSPLMANLKGIPPILIQAGADEILLDDSRRFTEQAQRAGVDMTLEVWPHMWHDWIGCVPDLPEAIQAIEHIAEFIHRHV